MSEEVGTLSSLAEINTLLRAAGIVDRDTVSTDRLVEDLGIDSLGMFAMACELEGLVGEPVEDELLMSMDTVRDVVEWTDVIRHRTR